MQPRLDRVLCVFLLLTTVRAFAGDDDNKPAPRFRAKTTSGESFNNESVKGQSRSARVLDHLVPVLSPGGAASRGHQPGARRQGTDRSRHRCCRIQENGQEISRTASRACRIVLTEDTNLAAMYQANSIPFMESLIAAETSPASNAAPPAKRLCADCWPAPIWNPQLQTGTMRTKTNQTISDSCGSDTLVRRLGLLFLIFDLPLREPCGQDPFIFRQKAVRRSCESGLAASHSGPGTQIHDAIRRGTGPTLAISTETHWLAASAPEWPLLPAPARR